MKHELNVETVTKLEGITLSLTPREFDIIKAAVGSCSPSNLKTTLSTATANRLADMDNQEVYDLYYEMVDVTRDIEDHYNA